MPVTAHFRWPREIPMLPVAADQDASLPLEGMHEIFERAPEPKKMVVLERADHMHFVDDLNKMHEAFRTMPVPADLAVIQADMRPIAEPASLKRAHRFILAVTLAHFLRHAGSGAMNLPGRPTPQRACRGAELSWNDIALEPIESERGYSLQSSRFFEKVSGA
jgi:hypothetical protein